jgi:hypothetical protein
VRTDAGRDHTVTVHASGLRPASTDCYRCHAENEVSAIDRTRTLRLGATPRLRHGRGELLEPCRRLLQRLRPHRRARRSGAGDPPRCARLHHVSPRAPTSTASACTPPRAAKRTTAGSWSSCAVLQGVRYSLRLHDRYGARVPGYDNAHAVKPRKKSKFEPGPSMRPPTRSYAAPWMWAFAAARSPGSTLTTSTGALAR